MLARTPLDQLTVKEFKRRVSGWLYEQANGIVQDGPFRGMKIPLERSWDDCVAPYILGCYEQELHRTIEYEIGRLSSLPSPKIVNLGCAEGYYAVGMACRIPKATVWVVDNPKAMGVAGLAASFNGARLMAGGTLDVILSKPDLVISDCEGAEVDYFDKREFPDLYRATIIVECHECGDRGEEKTMPILANRFCDSHYVMQVLPGPRNPANFKLLEKVQPTSAQWLLMDEGRPKQMRWLVMRPKNKC